MKINKKSIIINKSNRYQKYEYKLEKDLVKDIVDKSKEIFGNKIHYFDKEKLIKSVCGSGTRPDGFAIDFENNILYVIEIELKGHSVKTHVLPQIMNFILALKNPEYEKELIEFLIIELKKKNIKKTFNDFKEIFKNWRILVIIDEITMKLIEFLRLLSLYEKKIIVIPFKKYIKENSKEKEENLYYFQSFDITGLKIEVERKWNFKWETVPIENHLENVSQNIKEIYKELSSKICNISSEVKEVHRQKWTTYQISKLKNFCTIKFFPDKLEIYIKADKNNFLDKNNLCVNIKRTPAWTFDKKIEINSIKNINEIIKLIEQSYYCVCK